MDVIFHQNPLLHAYITQTFVCLYNMLHYIEWKVFNRIQNDDDADDEGVDVLKDKFLLILMTN